LKHYNYKPVQKTNPFSAEQRKEMILSSIDDSIKEKISIYFIPDLENHVKWIEKIDVIVPKFDIVFSNDELTTHLYSKRSIQVIPFLKRDVLSGTNIRNLIISDQQWGDFVPLGTKNFLINNNAKEHLKNL
jgi:nicotinamide-nucleotide adenylyltransferase